MTKFFVDDQGRPNFPFILGTIYHKKRNTARLCEILWYLKLSSES